MPASLDSRIHEYLAFNPGKTAQELAGDQGEDKKSINSRRREAMAEKIKRYYQKL